MNSSVKYYRGIISNNDRKREQTQPDLTGSVVIEGRTYMISGWYDRSKDRDFISLSFNLKQSSLALGAKPDPVVVPEKEPDGGPF